MPTITVRRFDYEALKARLTLDDRIVVLSCDSCAKQSNGLGGEQGLGGVADKLAADGFKVVRRELLPDMCTPEHLRDRLRDEAARKPFEEADVVIPLSCRVGVKMANEVLPDLRILRVTRTLGTGSFSLATGARLTKPLEGIGNEIDDAEGISVVEAAKRLGLYSGSF